ncbi:hypothetical protein DFJ69_6110 [Thermomonospora umbrina]|uniref:Uncharacterized protein n=1 Tax=Thermomonospora umbrina TaxID=111806 RepID=A0A3D9SX78_9ACTN|nr:hypothetical protein DFJ69_6110 [Thermomonospora umbrina]
MTTYTMTAERLEHFRFLRTGQQLVLVHEPCAETIRSTYGGEPEVEDGVDLEQLVRWSVEHRCPPPRTTRA